MKNILKTLPLSLFFLFFTLSPLRSIGLETTIGVTQQVPWGEVSYKGTSLDMRNDLNYGALNTFVGRIKVKTPLFLPNFYILASPMKFTGTGTRSIPFKYGDSAFIANATFDSTLKLDHYDTTLFYGIPFLKTETAGKLKAEFGLNVRLIDFKAEIIQTQSGLSQSKSLLLPIPMAYVGLQVAPCKWFQIQGELKGISYGTNRYYDAIGRARFKIISVLFVSGGYKFQAIHIDQSGVVADLRFGGPLFEIGLEF